jgi:hypothetical protein
MKIAARTPEWLLDIWLPVAVIPGERRLSGADRRNPNDLEHHEIAEAAPRAAGRQARVAAGLSGSGGQAHISTQSGSSAAIGCAVGRQTINYHPR